MISEEFLSPDRGPVASDTRLYPTAPDCVMIDIETMATSTRAAVIEIGAVVFNFNGAPVLYDNPDKSDMFAHGVDLVSTLMCGGETDVGTVKWWRDRGGYDPYGRPPVLFPEPIRVVLGRLSEFLESYPSIEEVWAKGPQFDLAVLAGYYERLKMPLPWAYNAGKDTRTISKAAKRRGWEPDLDPANEIPHVAHLDCRLQIKELRAACDFLKL